MNRTPLELLAGDVAARFAEGVTRLGDLELDVSLTPSGRGILLAWAVGNSGRAPARLPRIGVRFRLDPTYVLEHGWQSWSPVRLCRPNEVPSDRSGAPRWRRAMYHADPALAAGAVCGDQFLVDDAGVTGFLGGDTHFGTIVAGTGAGTIAWALLDGAVLQPDEQRHLHPVWFAEGEPLECYDEFARRWAAATRPRTAVRPPLGWCSWYRYAQDITPDDVRAQLAAAAEHGIDVIQIDDGWQAGIGDWSETSPSWQGELAPIATEVRAAGARAGIWTAPCLVAESSAVAAKNPGWLLRDDEGREVRAMHHPALWGGWTMALDLTHPEVHEHLHDIYAELSLVGFDVHKLDFLYAGALPGRHHDPSATRADALTTGLSVIRDALGDAAFILGCGSPLAPAVGVVDAMRVSPDTTPWWDHTWNVPGYEHSAPCTRNAVEHTRWRAPLHGRLWINDADCALLCHPREERTAEQRRTMNDAIRSTGYVTLSDDLRDYGDDEWATVEALVARQGSVRR